jgi:hypothetical protein
MAKTLGLLPLRKATHWTVRAIQVEHTANLKRQLPGAGCHAQDIAAD